MVVELIGLLVLAAVVLVIIGGAKANKTYDVPVESVAIPTGPEAIQRGEHVATVSCKRCHGDSLAGEVYFTVPGLLTIPTPNLTSGKGGVGSLYTPEDFVRAIRHGVARELARRAGDAYADRSELGVDGRREARRAQARRTHAVGRGSPA